MLVYFHITQKYNTLANTCLKLNTMDKCITCLWMSQGVCIDPKGCNPPKQLEIFK